VQKTRFWLSIFKFFCLLTLTFIVIGVSDRGPLEKTIRGANVPSLLIYLALGNDPNARVFNKSEPLIFAALNSPFPLQKFFLLKLFGANVNETTNGGDTALIAAIIWKDDSSACYLIKLGATHNNLSKDQINYLKNLNCD
jgi:ankyrin repeat protein